MNIATATQRVVAAEDALIKLLEKQFPIGTAVKFYVMHGQVNPSRGEVIGHEGGRFAYLRVRLESRASVVRSIPAGRVW